VQEGDFLELDGTIHATAGIRRFTFPPLPGAPGMPPAPLVASKQSQLVLDRVIEGTENPALGVQMTTGFRVVRAPRPLAGEAMVQIHKDVYIDLTACFPCPLNLDPPGASPSGINYSPDMQGYNAPPIAPPMSWGPQAIPQAQRLPQLNPVDVNYIDVLFNPSGFVANAPTGRYIIAVRHKDRPKDIHFVTIYTRTGKITNHAWNDGIGSPYLFTQDGSSPGL
jgi:hypothetical protein